MRNRWRLRMSAVLLSLLLAGCADTPLGSAPPSAGRPQDDASPTTAAQPTPEQVRPPGDLSVFALNVSGWEAFGLSWDERAARVAQWLAAHQPAPDVIALQDVLGQVEVFRPRRCDELPPQQGIANYGQVHRLVAELQARLDVSYRVAYLTGHSYQWPVDPGAPTPVCTAYTAQAMLYRPDLLHNRTAERQCAQCPSAEDWESWTDTPALRLSLPFCNDAATVSGVSLGELIDGEPVATDTCDQAPGGAVWAVFPPMSETEGTAPLYTEEHIVATAVEFTFVDDPDSGVLVVNAHPNSARPDRDRAQLEALIDKAAQEFQSRFTLYIPPVVTGDSNDVRLHEKLGLPFVAGTEPIRNESVMTFVGAPGSWPATHPGQVVEALFAPDGARETGCPGPSDRQLSDHCGLLTRLR